MGRREGSCDESSGEQLRYKESKRACYSLYRCAAITSFCGRPRARKSNIGLTDEFKKKKKNKRKSFHRFELAKLGVVVVHNGRKFTAVATTSA